MNRLVRMLLIVLAAVALVVGVGLGFISLRGTPTSKAKPVSEAGVNVLVAARPIPSGSLLRADSMVWRRLQGSKAPAGSIVRGSTSQAELVGSVSRVDIDEGALLTPAALVRPNERNFLAAVLTPGFRAVTIATDTQQGASGLVLPGDRVDVILVRQIADGTASGSANGEIMLRGARIIAVGREMTAKANEGGVTVPKTVVSADVTPKTVTLEVTPADAKRLFVGAQLGRLDLALRPLGEPVAIPLAAAENLTSPATPSAQPPARRRRAASAPSAAGEALAPVLIIRCESAREIDPHAPN